MNVAGGTLAIRSKIAVLGIVLLAVIAVDARAQDAITVAVGGRGIGESCVTEIGEKAGLSDTHGFKPHILYTSRKAATRQAAGPNHSQPGAPPAPRGPLSLAAKDHPEHNA